VHETPDPGKHLPASLLSWAGQQYVFFAQLDWVLHKVGTGEHDMALCSIAANEILSDV
jgi:hypothetical protein